ncbi:MAG: CDP-glucose 4,6-dehydratase [Thiothrix sp.]|uniref:CDP-glucose 4,6-dehydratase n=1 Tax=Thiothrix sp. TaxID=1032 RepID=UPI002614356F|nr:CDP-glucose 4,6-dehydratase [Thiothrix sp.]MDD5392924.1 CDP-glucose 4,6-dehydratase [Thiothrix sp.]
MKLSSFSGTRILLTGHTGFKGAWLTLWLTQLGAQVHGVSLGVPSEPSHFAAANLASRIKDHRLDICNGTALKVLVEEIKPDFVFHLAAQALVRRSYTDPVDTWQTNALGTINVLEALRTLKQPCIAVLITSDKCYDNVEWVWGYRETDALGGPDPYSASKGAAELAIRSYVRSFFPSDGAVRIGVGRAGNVIGGGDWAEDRIVPDCMRAWSQRETVPLRNPLATRPWQHVLEPLSGYLTLAMALKTSTNLHGEPFNFGPAAQQNHSVGELVSAMTEHWDRVRWEDVSAQYGGPYESGLLKLNCDKALHHLGWRAIWDFKATVRETALWYRQYYEQPRKSITDFSLAQIAAYVQAAKTRGVTWAQ